MAIASILVPHPSQYAIQKLNTFDYVELWYFFPEDCANAACNNRSQADDTFGLSKVDNILTVHLVTSVRALWNTLTDQELSFESFLQAKNSFLIHAKRASWPTNNLNTLEDMGFPLTDLSQSSPMPSRNDKFGYNMGNIDWISKYLCILWEASKNIPFSDHPTFIGLTWDLTNHTITLAEHKMRQISGSNLRMGDITYSDLAQSTKAT